MMPLHAGIYLLNLSVCLFITFAFLNCDVHMVPIVLKLICSPVNTLLSILFILMAIIIKHGLLLAFQLLSQWLSLFTLLFQQDKSSDSDRDLNPK